MENLQSQIKQLHQSLIDNFKIIRSENDDIFNRLEKIEKSLDKDKEDHTKAKTFRKSDKEKIVRKTGVKENNNKVDKKKIPKAKVQKTEKKKKKSKITKIETDDSTKEESNEEEELDENQDIVQLYDESSINLAAEETLEENDQCLDDGKRHDVEVKILPEKVFEGFCFRPITGWKNPDGAYEISKEIIEFNHKLVNIDLLILRGWWLTNDH